MRDETLVRLLSFVLLLLRSLTPTPARSITAHSGHGLHGHRMPERGQSDRDGGSLSGDAFDGNPALMFIDEHQGRISIKSVPGQGTAITIRLAALRHSMAVQAVARVRGN